ncbi:MAG: small subunit ribosomal protein S9 [Alteromonas naphthalenivorans]|jgi:small subunit ribosomal protein S9
MVKTKTAEKKPAEKKTTTPKSAAAPKAVVAPKVEAAPKKVAPKKAAEPKKTISASDKVVAVPRKKAASTPIIGAVGRRKRAVARVWVRRGTGGVAINKERCADYFNTDETRTSAVKGLVACDVLSKYDVIANVKGGGKVAQAEAVNLGVARALIKDDEAYRVTLRANGSLTVDSRNKERKKPGQKGARAKFQFVKR